MITSRSRRSSRVLILGQTLGVLASLLVAGPAFGQIVTVPTMNLSDLAAALNPSGFTAFSVSIKNGVAGQFGTYSNFELLPVTIRPGIVLSSGDVTNLRPIPGATDPGYDPASPPAQVNNQMNPEPVTGGTAEFDAYGYAGGNIENFQGSYDVAALRVDFVLDNPGQVKFDFIFASVEFPFYTSSFTDSFLVFLDGTDPANQITFDSAGNAVQVGSSFAGLQTTGDLNTAFSDPHGLIHHLTTTTPVLADGEHFLIFEVGDVNDHILDSAAFITNFRVEAGPPGTDESDDPPYANCPNITAQPVSAATCASGAAPFSVTATGPGPLSYRWQIQSAPGVWTNLSTTPVALACGGSASASSPQSPSTQISVTPCAGTSSYRVRCRVGNDCDTISSDAARLSICVADSDCDGQIAPADVAVFVNTWFASLTQGTLAGDFDGSGSVDPADIAAFVNAWFEALNVGC